MATASRCRVTAKSVAVRRGSASAANVGALLDNPYRANAAILFAGTAEQSTRRTPRPLSWDTRSNAATNERPEIRVGARRHDSNSDNRAPGGTPNASRSLPANIGSAAPAADASRPCIRSAAASLTAATNRSSTEIPGSKTRFRRSHPTP